jgi:hypothetical protein
MYLAMASREMYLAIASCEMYLALVARRAAPDHGVARDVSRIGGAARGARREARGARREA